MASSSIIPGAERPAAPPEAVRRIWLARRVAASEAAVSLILERSLGELPYDALRWPTPSWAGPVREPALV